MTYLESGCLRQEHAFHALVLLLFEDAVRVGRVREREAVRDDRFGIQDSLTNQLEQVPGLRIIGRAKEKVSVLSFVVDRVHPQDLGILLDNRGVAVRTGHHCTQPLMDFFCIPGTTRASFAMYNTIEEIDVLTEGLHKAIKMLA